MVSKQASEISKGLNTRASSRKDDTCLCGAPMQNGVCSVRGCVCSKAEIAKHVTSGLDRRKMRAGSKPVVVKAAKAAKPKTAKKAKVASDDKVTQHKPTAKMQEEIDNAIRAAVKKAFGNVVAVAGLLGMRNSNSKVGGAPYQRYYLANGHTVFVSGWHQGEPRVTVSDKLADKKSYTVAAFLERFKRKQARTDAKAAEAKRTAAVPAKATKIA
jgi:hypothetical protein